MQIIPMWYIASKIHFHVYLGIMEILLIDDHQRLRVATASMLESTGRFTVCGQAESLAQAVDFIEKAETLPSIVILDINLGEDYGLDFLPLLEKHCADKKIAKPPVLVCSANDDSFTIQTALKLGATGFLSKISSADDMIEAIDALLSGKAYVYGEPCGEKTNGQT